jgi:hypothetical protein
MSSTEKPSLSAIRKLRKVAVDRPLRSGRRCGRYRRPLLDVLAEQRAVPTGGHDLRLRRRAGGDQPVDSVQPRRVEGERGVGHEPGRQRPRSRTGWVRQDWDSIVTELGRLLADGRDALDTTKILTGTGTNEPVGILNIGGTGGLTTTQRVQTAGAGTIAIGDVYALKRYISALGAPGGAVRAATSSVFERALATTTTGVPVPTSWTRRS